MVRYDVVAAVVVSVAVGWFWPTHTATTRQVENASLARVSRPATRGGGEIATLEGRVVGIADGDTFTLLTPAQRQVRVRLAEIDAPEHDQPWGARAKQALSALIFGKNVTVHALGLDRYGRTLGRVFAGGVDVNAELLREGAAWAYRQYLTDSSLLGVEQQARDAKRGVWSLAEAERAPPWDWRHQARTGSPPLRTSHAELTCGTKRYCGQMLSCAEARHYLRVCGMAQLDGDRDGVPCESLCREGGGHVRN